MLVTVCNYTPLSSNSRKAFCLSISIITSSLLCKREARGRVDYCLIIFTCKNLHMYQAHCQPCTGGVSSGGMKSFCTKAVQQLIKPPILFISKNSHMLCTALPLFSASVHNTTLAYLFIIFFIYEVCTVYRILTK